MPFAKDLGPVRHLTIHPTGAVIAATRAAPGIQILRDIDGDGIADSISSFGIGEPGNGVAWANDWLYFSSESAIVRWHWPASAGRPEETPEWLIDGLPIDLDGYAHNAKGIAAHPDGSVYYSIGSRSDNCAPNNDAVPGLMPCPELETRAGIWKLVPERDGKSWRTERVSTGLRNAMPITVDSVTGRVWALSHGRDALHQRWGWTAKESADQPGEMLFAVTSGTDFGWPYCMPIWSSVGNLQYTTAPEYAGVSSPATDCSTKSEYLRSFPGHWAPMAVAFSNNSMPAGWRRGAFIAFHGSRGRRPMPEDGHYALFVTLDESGSPSGPERIFMISPSGPGALRLSGVAVSSDGKVYLADDDHGKIYMVRPGSPTKR
jgi:glucose/arabinose dehydrogenase